MTNLFDILFIPNIIVFVLACIAALLKYEDYLKLHNAVVRPISCSLGRVFCPLGICIVDKFSDTNISFPRSSNGRLGIRQFHSKLNGVGTGSNAELYTPFFMRPKPSIKDLPPLRRDCSPYDNIVINGKNVNLHGGSCTELYVNVINEGKTTHLVK